MSSHWNGSPLPEGARHCLAMPAGPMRRTTAARQTPQLTRSQMMRLGCVFPARSVPRVVKARPKQSNVPLTAAESARILELFGGGKTVAETARPSKRSEPSVRRVLIENHIDPAANCCAANPMRPRIVELLRENVSAPDIATITGASLAYVRTTASNLKRAEKEAA